MGRQLLTLFQACLLLSIPAVAQENVMTLKGGCQAVHQSSTTRSSNDGGTAQRSGSEVSRSDSKPADSTARNESAFTSRKFCAVARRSGKLDLFNTDGQVVVAIPIDSSFVKASPSDEHEVLITERVNPESKVKRYKLFNDRGAKLLEGSVVGRDMQISPNGRYGMTSEADLLSDEGRLQLIDLTTNKEVTLPGLTDGFYMGARFTDDNSAVVIWNTRKDGKELIRLLKFDLREKTPLKQADVLNEQGDPVGSALHLMTCIQSSPDNRLFAFFAIDKQFEQTAGEELPNTIVIFDQDLEVRALGGERVLHSASIPNNSFVCYTAHYVSDEKIANVKHRSNDPRNKGAMLEIYNFPRKSVQNKIPGLYRNLANCAEADGKIYCNYDVNATAYLFDIGRNEFAVTDRQDTDNPPIATIGQKKIRYSYINKTHYFSE